MAFVKGKSGNPNGKPVGTVSKLTKTFKELVVATIESIQDHPKANLQAWAEENPTEFYKIAAKLIPSEVSATVQQTELRHWEILPIIPNESQ